VQERERVELRKRGAFAAKSMHSKEGSGTQIEEIKYNSEWRRTVQILSRPYNCSLAQKSRRWTVQISG
jgi:hypothetical protein